MPTSLPRPAALPVLAGLYARLDAALKAMEDDSMPMSYYRRAKAEAEAVRRVIVRLTTRRSLAAA